MTLQEKKQELIAASKDYLDCPFAKPCGTCIACRSNDRQVESLIAFADALLEEVAKVADEGALNANKRSVEAGDERSFGHMIAESTFIILASAIRSGKGK